MAIASITETFKKYKELENKIAELQSEAENLESIKRRLWPLTHEAGHIDAFYSNEKMLEGKIEEINNLEKQFVRAKGVLIGTLDQLEKTHGIGRVNVDFEKSSYTIGIQSDSANRTVFYCEPFERD